jgi:formylglycine-generating enzyme required for sulfatase activity
MTVLFLDSNETTRGPRTAALAAVPGWSVTAAGSVPEALAWLETAPALDLLITEAVIDAGSTGFQVRNAALTRFPDASVLFTTRYDLAGFEDQIGGWPVLADAPFSEEKLVRRAQAVLSEPSSAQAPEAPPSLAPGTLLGSYQVLERLSTERQSETYRALQVSVQRPVALVLLRPSLAGDAKAVQEFKERERLKASISHPRIAPLYEAGEVGGLIFYTRELPRGQSLGDVHAAGGQLSERKLAELLYGVAEAMQHAVERGHDHRRLTARDIYLDTDGQASIVNIFRPAGPRPRVASEEVHALLALLEPYAAEGKARGLLAELRAASHDWAGLLAAVDEVRDAMRERSIMRRIEAEESQVASARPTPWWTWALAVLALVAVFVLGSLAGKSGASGSGGVRELEMVRIPAGEFTYQNGQKRRLPDFWISRHEVTIGQYAEFLEAMGGSGINRAFDHPDQPATKTSHLPPKWQEVLAAAKAGGTYNGQPISLSTPVTQADWWDAYAFARWKGQRLPTEEEWEKAARGTKGNRFPWGTKKIKDAANLGDDYANGSGQSGPVRPGSLDGHVLWAPVDRKTADVSEFGVQDMAGNVSEWTASERKGEPWPAHPDYPDLRVPVVRGGHFALKSSDDLLTTRFFADSASEATLARGFRTVADQAPPGGE